MCVKRECHFYLFTEVFWIVAVGGEGYLNCVFLRSIPARLSLCSIGYVFLWNRSSGELLFRLYTNGLWIMFGSWRVDGMERSEWPAEMHRPSTGAQRREM